MELEHFFHKHPLTFPGPGLGQYDAKHCSGCYGEVYKDFYCCNICRYSCPFNLCTSCFKMRREIQHPFHQHPLTLLAKPPYVEESDDYPNNGLASCSVCHSICRGFTFHCSKCEFNMHVYCSTLMPITNTNKKNNYYHRTTVEEQHFTHPHPLIPCCRDNEDIEFRCTVCEVSIKGTIYACLECGYILDKSCAQLPQQITHPFHPHHSLTLKDFAYYDSDLHPSGCRICQTFQGRISYRCCSDCSFALDVRCASVMPNPLVTISDDVDDQDAFTHPHPLIPCNATNPNFKFYCSACRISIEEGTLIYVCVVCWIFLHKSCAELPPVIQHPFHPPHPLQLEPMVFHSCCEACQFSDGGFSYHCGECKFRMDVRCASLAYTTVKIMIHEHPLAYIKDNTPSMWVSNAICSGCKRTWGFPCLRCVPCGFSIRLCCLPRLLPVTFKHSDHGHSLTYTEECIKHHPDQEEYYCDSCENIRSLHDPTYYCTECPFVAELSCVFDEILEYLQERKLSLPAGLDDKNYTSVIVVLDKEIVMLNAQLEALVPKAATLNTKMEELQERRVQLCSDNQIGVAEMETRNVSTYQTTSLNSALDHPAIAKLDEEIAKVAAEREALAMKELRLEVRLDELKSRYQGHLGGYQIGEIPSLGIGTKPSVTIVDDCENVVVEDRIVRNTRKEDENEDNDGTFSTFGNLDIMKSKLEELKKKRDEEIDALASLEALKRKSDEEIEALTTHIEAIKMKCS